ncbi:ubiquitin domain-containing 1-like [Chlorella sorokiniana]|jgi:hypothetical protein|uniref:Ubiquitin domain-containing 1-like n=1 Tax=Chlorella sorokiniana TaxID=3076 RepID=A0A2P6TUG4_CHLSO|nr:ubiquitin domain-containing 1-like [Chlorella sorokiniana]|eukprot:PRW57718.1 ubiquitin domain-containing 1-like [Chlorella sorokiniana]
MGAACCKPEPDEPAEVGVAVKTWKRPKWKSEEPMTEEQLQRMCEQFWDTEPHYGGARVIWDALRAACDADVATARTILESADIIVAAPDMSVCYDVQGRKYELPRYVICAPTNLIHEGGKGSSALRSTSGVSGGAVELPAVAAGAAVAAGSGGSSGGSPDSQPETAPLAQVAVR